MSNDKYRRKNSQSITVRRSCWSHITLFISEAATIGVLRNFAKFTGKDLCQSLCFNKVTGLRPASLLKERLWHRCFPVNFAKFLRTSFSRTPLSDCFYHIRGAQICLTDCLNNCYFHRAVCKQKNIRRNLTKRQYFRPVVKMGLQPRKISVTVKWLLWC